MPRTQQTAINLVLQHLNLTLNTSFPENRRQLQNTIYLVQRAGLNLNYKFGWYTYGPFAPKLNEHTTPTRQHQHELSGKAKTMLDAVRALLDCPAPAGVTRAQWVELLAAYDFLRSKSRQDHQEATRTLQTTKPALAQHTLAAQTTLERHPPHPAEPAAPNG